MNHTFRHLVRARLVPLSCVMILGGCVTNEPSPPQSSGLCAPFDAQLNEIAAYRFIDKVSGTSEVRVTITSISGPLVSMQIEEEKNTSNVIFDTRCEEGRNKDLVLSKNAAHILFGVSWPPPSPSSSGEGTGSPAPEPVIASQCESESITITVGTFVAKKCSYSYASAGSAVKKTTEYTIDPQQELRPFTGMLKEIITFADASENSAELIEWNGK